MVLGMQPFTVESLGRRRSEASDVRTAERGGVASVVVVAAETTHAKGIVGDLQCFGIEVLGFAAERDHKSNLDGCPLDYRSRSLSGGSFVHSQYCQAAVH